MNSNTRIYFIQVVGGGPIKIGCSADPLSRMQTLTNWSPYPLEILGHVPGCRVAEASIHQKFSSHRVNGEWFSPAEELTAFVSGCIAAGELPASIPNMVAAAAGIVRGQSNLLAVLRERGVSVREISDRMGVPYTTMRRWTNFLPESRAVQIAEFLTGIGLPTGALELYAPPPVFAARRTRKSPHIEHGATA